MFPSTKTFRWINFLESNIPFLFWHRRFWSICKLCAGQMLTFQQASRAQRSFAFAPTKAIFTFFGAIPFGQLKVTPARPKFNFAGVFCYSDLTYGDCFFLVDERWDEDVFVGFSCGWRWYRLVVEQGDDLSTFGGGSLMKHSAVFLGKKDCRSPFFGTLSFFFALTIINKLAHADNIRVYIFSYL